MTIHNAKTYAHVTYSGHTYTLELAILAHGATDCSVKRTTPGHQGPVDASEAKKVVAAFINNLPKF